MIVCALLNGFLAISIIEAQPNSSPVTDLDGDGIVGHGDLEIVAAIFGSREGDSRFNPKADLDGNKCIDIRDIALVAKDFGKAYYTLTINVSGGTTDPSSGSRYIQGKKVNITVTPDEGWTFNRWSGDITGYKNPVTIFMNSNKNVTAHLIPPYLHNQQILFVDENHSVITYNLCVMNADGKGRQILLENYDYVCSPTYSPDGKMIAVCYYKPWVGPRTLAILNLTGYILKTVNCSDSPSWAPDGKSVIYGRYYNGLYELNVETGETQQILDTNDATYDHCPVWSPDMSKLVFVHHEWGEDFYVCLIDFNRSKIPYQGEDRYNNHLNPEIHVLLNGSSMFNYDFDLQWTPDGRKIIFELMAPTDSDSPDRIYIVDVENQSVMEIQNELLSFEFCGDSVQLSPDGKEIAIIDNDSLCLVDVDGTNLHEIVKIDTILVSKPIWSPDGQYIAFMDYEDLCVVSRNGLEQYVFPDTAAWPTELDWRPFPTTD